MDSFSGRSYRPAPQREDQGTEAQTEVASRPVVSSTRRRDINQKSHLPWRMVLLAFVTIALIVAGWLAWRWFVPVTVPGVKADAYQAIWLTDKSLYFGKLRVEDDEYYRLTDVFYTQVAQTTDSKPTDPANVQLVKLGNELPYSEDEMMIAKKQVLFYENLKSDSKVTQVIQEYTSKNK
jgi:hypothetical protein